MTEYGRRFRKKPVVIEAELVVHALKAAASGWRDLPVWLDEAYEKGDVIFLPDGIVIQTLEGKMRADAGDWIIRGVKGELYPCRSDIFDATYEPAD